MSLDCILLGLLRHPSSGSDLHAWFTHAFHHFWSAEPSQIYRTLARLEADGLLTAERRPSPKGAPHRVYRMTPAGRRTLRMWLDDGPSMSDTRQSQLAQILFLSELPPGKREAFLSDLRGQYELRLAQLRNVAASVPDDADPRTASDEDELFRRLTLAAGLHQYESWIGWIEKALELHTAWVRARSPGTGDQTLENEGETSP